MRVNEFVTLMDSVRKITEYGWVYTYTMSKGVGIKKMAHSEYGEFEFGTWLKLKEFVDKWESTYKIKE